METLLRNLFLENFSRKLFSFIAALLIWILVNNSITITRTFPRVAVRIVNMPADTTIRGLMPDGFLKQKISLTITGNKHLLEQLQSSDFAVILDATNKSDEWIVHISSKNLVSRNPEIKLLHAILHVTANEFILHLCPLVSARIPVFIIPPQGESPEGYQFLNIWPQRLYHTVSGPKEDVEELEETGLELEFDLSNISTEMLDTIRAEDPFDEEVSFFVPDTWKKVKIPFLNNAVQSLTTPEAEQLRIDFLYKTLLPIEEKIGIRVFYPIPTLERINPATCVLQPSEFVHKYYDRLLITKRLYAQEVSRLFLDIVKDRIEIVLVPILKQNSLIFRWDVQFIDEHQLEEAYVSLALSREFETKLDFENPIAIRHQLMQREQYVRNRFKDYMRTFRLYRAEGIPLSLSIHREHTNVYVEEVLP